MSVIKTKTILYICSEAAPGLVAYATSILLAASGSEHLIVHAITVDDKHHSYRPYLFKLPGDKIRWMQTPEKRFEKIRNKLYAANLLREVKKICSRYKIDIIHLLTVDYTCATIFAQLKKICPVYYTVHDVVPHEKAYTSFKDYFFSKYIRWGVKRMMQKSDFLVTNSQSQYRVIKAMFSNKNIYFQLFPPLITAPILSGSKICPELIDCDKYVLFFGNIDKYKGVEYLYEAFLSNPQLHDYKLVIAGKGSIYFPHSDHPHVLFINRYIADEEVKSLFTRSSCVVYPYISATQSGVLTIAYKFQTPALVSEIPYFREVSDNNCALFFNRADAGDLSDKLETLLFRTDINEMKKAQKKYFEAHNSEKAMIASTEKLYIVENEKIM